MVEGCERIQQKKVVWQYNMYKVGEKDLTFSMDKWEGTKFSYCIQCLNNGIRKCVRWEFGLWGMKMEVHLEGELFEWIKTSYAKYVKSIITIFPT